MKRLYVDSSVIVAILFEEAEASRYRKILEESEGLYSSSLLEAEVYSAARREEVPLQAAADLIDHITLIFPDRSLKEEYTHILSHGYSRGSDTFHLATLLYLDPQKSELSLLTADQSQERLAEKIGIRVLPSTE